MPNRSRDWRRFQQDRVYRNRLKRFCSSWYRFRTANGDSIQEASWIDCIGLKEYYLYKNIKTNKNDSKSKAKYSPNSVRSYWRNFKPKGLSTGKRESDKILSRKIINDGYIQYYTE